MTAPYFKARWNDAVGYVQAEAILPHEQVQELLKKSEGGTYVKHVTVDGEQRFAQVLQWLEKQDLVVKLIVSAATKMPHSWMFNLDNLPSVSYWDTIEFKGLSDAQVKALNLEVWSDFIPCPQPYLDAINAQDGKWVEPEGW